MGKPRVLAEKCSTCVFRPGNPMHLRPGRLARLVEDNLRAGALLMCHKTTFGQQPEEAACRGFLDAFGPHVNLVRVMERIAALSGDDCWYEEVPAP